VFVPAAFKFQAERKPWLRSRTGPALVIDPFQRPVMPLRERLESAALAISLLVAESLVLVSLALLRFERYDVR
jgi:hypothetical protein